VLLGGWDVAVPGRRRSRCTEDRIGAAGGQSEIERVTRQVSEEQVERDKVSRELRSAEVSVEGLARAWTGSVAARGTCLQARLTPAEKRAREGDLNQNRRRIGWQCAPAYLIGREEPLKLLLIKRIPSVGPHVLLLQLLRPCARRADPMAIENDVQTIATLDGQLQEEDAKLAAGKNSSGADLAELEQARAKRSESAGEPDGGIQLARAEPGTPEEPAGGLEKLLRELQRAIEKVSDRQQRRLRAFARQACLPVGGKLMARFGETRAGGVKWGWSASSRRSGAHPSGRLCGRVIYADWLPGSGC